MDPQVTGTLAQYAAKIMKVDPDKGLLNRLEREIRFVQEVAEPAGQCRAQNMPLQSQSKQAFVASAFGFTLPTASQLCLLLDTY